MDSIGVDTSYPSSHSVTVWPSGKGTPASICRDSAGDHRRKGSAVRDAAAGQRVLKCGHSTKVRAPTGRSLPDFTPAYSP